MEKYKWIFASSRGCEIEMTEITCSVDEAKEYMLLKIAAEAEKSNYCFAYPPKYEKDLQIETSSKTGEVIAIKCLNVEKFYGGIINYLMRRADVYKRKEVEKYVKKVAEAIGRIFVDDVCTIFNAVMNTTSEKVVKKNKKI